MDLRPPSTPRPDLETIASPDDPLSSVTPFYIAPNRRLTLSSVNAPVNTNSRILFMGQFDNRVAPTLSSANDFLSTPRPDAKISPYRPVVSNDKRPSGKNKEDLQDRTTVPLTNSSLLSFEVSNTQISNNYDVSMRIEEVRSRLLRFDIQDVFSFVCPNPEDKNTLFAGTVELLDHFQIVSE